MDNACFQHNMAYCKCKDFTTRTESDKVLRDKAFKVASNPEYDGYQRGLTSMVYNFFDKRSAGSGIKSTSNCNLQMNFINQLLENLKDAKSIFLLNVIFGELI